MPGVSDRIFKPGARVWLNGVLVAENLSNAPAAVRPLGHRIAFRVHRHNRIEPNTAEVQIYGLSQAKREGLTRAFEAARAAVFASGDTAQGVIGDLVLEAGYDGMLSQLIRADLIDLYHEPQNPGYVTVIQAQDGVVPWVGSVVNESIAPGVSVDLVKTILTQSMRIAFLDADSEKAFQEALTGFSARKLEGGFVMQGPTRQVLTELLESLKLSWSFQDGKLQLLRFDQTKTDVAVLLSPQTGLVKTPKIGKLGRVTADSRLNPLLSPGRQVSLVNGLGVPIGAGLFRVDQVDHTGDLEGGTFESVVDLRPSKAV